MADSDSKHVSVSDVSEDSKEVDGMCGVLEAAGIRYWLDRSALGPGDAWKAKIREAISNGALLFPACFSDSSGCVMAARTAAQNDGHRVRS